MTITTARLRSPEEIALNAGLEIARLRLPERATLFAERAMRLRQLAAGHAMRDYLLFIAQLSEAQHAALQAFPTVPLPSKDDLDAAARAGQPALPHAHWPRDAAWRTSLRALLADLLAQLPADSPARAGVQAVQQASDDWLEQQATRLVGGVTLGLDFAAAPLVAAGLQVYWTHLVAATQAAHAGGEGAFGYTDDATRCPCCGSLPTASVTRVGADASGYRYLHCALCSAQWHMVRVKCTHCLGTKGIQYQALQRIEGQAATHEAVQAETCDTCGHYLKIVHMGKDPHVDPVADDLATLTLDLLVSDAGLQRHGVNLMLLFGDPEPEAPPATAPGGA